MPTNKKSKANQSIHLGEYKDYTLHRNRYSYDVISPTGAVVGYYSDLDSALKAILLNVIVDENTKMTLSDYVTRQEQIWSEMGKAFSTKC